jgi:hypothetical protein
MKFKVGDRVIYKEVDLEKLRAIVKNNNFTQCRSKFNHKGIIKSIGNSAYNINIEVVFENEKFSTLCNSYELELDKPFKSHLPDWM